jgi:hypothetical protein
MTMYFYLTDYIQKLLSLLEGEIIIRPGEHQDAFKSVNSPKKMATEYRRPTIDEVQYSSRFAPS